MNFINFLNKLVFFIVFFLNIFNASDADEILNIVKKKIIERDNKLNVKVDEIKFNSIFNDIKVDYQDILYRINSDDAMNEANKEFILKSLAFCEKSLAKPEDLIEIIIDLYDLMQSEKIIKNKDKSFHYNLIIEYCFYKINEKSLNDFSTEIDNIFSKNDRDKELKEFFYKNILNLNYIPNPTKQAERIELNLENLSKDTIYDEYANIFSGDIVKMYENKSSSVSELDSEKDKPVDFFSEIYSFLIDKNEKIKDEIIKNNENLTNNLLLSIKLNKFVGEIKESTKYVVDKIKSNEQFKNVFIFFSKYSELKINTGEDFLIICSEIFEMVKSEKLQIFSVQEYIVDISKNLIVQYLFFKLKDAAIKKNLDEWDKVSNENDLKKKIENFLYKNVLELIDEKNEHESKLLSSESEIGKYKIYVEPVVLMIFDELNGIKIKKSIPEEVVNKETIINKDVAKKYENNSKSNSNGTFGVSKKEPDINNKKINEEKIKKEKIEAENKEKKQIEMAKKYSNDLFKKTENEFSEKSIVNLLLGFKKDYESMSRGTKDKFSYIFDSIGMFLEAIDKWLLDEQKNENFKNLNIHFETVLKEIEEKNVEIELVLGSNKFSNDDLALADKYLEIKNLENEVNAFERDLIISSGSLKENYNEIMEKFGIKSKIIEKMTKTGETFSKTIFDYLNDVGKDQDELKIKLEELSKNWGRF